MKRIVLILLGSLFVFFGQMTAQDSLAQNYSREVGLDLNFVNTFLPLPNDINIGNRGRYQFYYRKYRPGKRVLRMGLDARIRGNFRESDSATDTGNNYIFLNYRVGWGKQRSLFNKVILFTGIDLLIQPGYSNSFQDYSTQFNVEKGSSSAYSLGTGLGPFVGLQYNITPRIGVFTELSYYLQLSYSLNTLKAVRSGRTSTFTTHAFSYSDNLRLPTSIALFYKF